MQQTIGKEIPSSKFQTVWWGEAPDEPVVAELAREDARPTGGAIVRNRELGTWNLELGI
jgi:hypothetical protein